MLYNTHGRHSSKGPFTPPPSLPPALPPSLWVAGTPFFYALGRCVQDIHDIDIVTVQA